MRVSSTLVPWSNENTSTICVRVDKQEYAFSLLSDELELMRVGMTRLYERWSNENKPCMRVF